MTSSSRPSEPRSSSSGTPRARRRPLTTSAEAIDGDAAENRADADGVTPVKKRTRRGSRGGRRRRKPAGAATGADGATELGEDGELGRRTGQRRRSGVGDRGVDRRFRRTPTSARPREARTDAEHHAFTFPAIRRRRRLARARRGSRLERAPTIDRVERRRSATSTETDASDVALPKAQRPTVTRLPSSSARPAAGAEAARTTARSPQRRETRSRPERASRMGP